MVEEVAQQPSRNHAVLCVDFGSTFTKAALVDLASGTLLGTAAHRTTIDTDVLDGYDACLAALAEQDPAARDADVLACSSAGGGLRIAVVGNEELVTAEAGRRVALSSGGKVVAVLPMSDGGLDGEAFVRRNLAPFGAVGLGVDLDTVSPLPLAVYARATAYHREPLASDRSYQLTGQAGVVLQF